MKGDTETSDLYWVICPHCGYRHRDGWEMVGSDEQEREHNCSECEKPFLCWAEVSTTYCTKPVPDNPHPATRSGGE